MTDPARGYLAHRTPGRARIKIPERRGDAAFFQGLAELAGGLAGVLGVEANPLTGSVLLTHSGDLEPILEQLGETLIVKLVGEGLEESAIAESVYREFRVINEWLRGATAGTGDLGSLMLMLLLFGAVVQWLRGQVLAPAATLLWYASSLVLMSRARGTPERPSGVTGGASGVQEAKRSTTRARGR